jgi:hypothetical protein
MAEQVEPRCICGSLALSATVSERHDRGLHGANVCIASFTTTSPVQAAEFDAALARLRESHAPEDYEFETEQTYCPASDGPTDQCDVCIVLIGSGLPPTRHTPPTTPHADDRNEES